MIWLIPTEGLKYLIGSIKPYLAWELFNGESLNFIFKVKLKSDFDKADFFYDIHIFSNYTLIALISLHILAVLIHRVLFKENILRRIT